MPEINNIFYSRKIKFDQMANENKLFNTQFISVSGEENSYLFNFYESEASIRFSTSGSTYFGLAVISKFQTIPTWLKKEMGKRNHIEEK